ncbi:DUF411 domain-containing protein [Sphingomonas humi]|uniref:DUF411 domain-containing protein n=1 Tax=Sphingomonas humi TaxID=335630 RepID=A0ABP7RPG5_9SPHN
MSNLFEMPSRRQLLAVAATGLALAAVPALAAPTPAMVTWRDPGCGCCIKWVEAMRRAGFAVTVRESQDMAAVKTRLKVPAALASCHTSEIGGLVVEGHVPADAIRKLLARRPAGVIGIAAPGMPRGSPGMEMPDGSKDPLNLTLFDARGRSRPFA